MIDPNDPAYPLYIPGQLDYGFGAETFYGLTKREDIATKLMAAIASNPKCNDEDACARVSVKWADALIKALNEK